MTFSQNPEFRIRTNSHNLLYFKAKQKKVQNPNSGFDLQLMTFPKKVTMSNPNVRVRDVRMAETPANTKDTNDFASRTRTFQNLVTPKPKTALGVRTV